MPSRVLSRICVHRHVVAETPPLTSSANWQCEKTLTSVNAFPDKLGPQENAPRSIVTTWAISVEQLFSEGQEGQDAVNMLKLWAYLHHDDLWYELFYPVSIEKFSEHQENVPDWLRRVAVGGYEQPLTILPCYKATTSKIPDATSADRMFGVATISQHWGYLDGADGLYEGALRGVEKARGPDHTSTLGIVNNLGNLYSDQGKMAEAEEMYLRALKGKEKACGPEHTSTLNTVNNQGNLYKNQGKMVEAEEMYLRALRGYEKAWGLEHTSTLETVNNLGVLYSIQGKMAEAEEMYLQALEGKEKA
ncbi:hypothetical protein LTR48_003563 [Friedmanniomyces endolithicus]|uniref:MalT-like TPR region domain-containing protein n=1 Tax=Rachicladosporium monterosium TaxID=1507873 RepID=A0ABR0L7Y6_9PEZI|nr:hypothetical protein LTR48_003563 [Friedmanniomyces endolithicus]KAK5144888.1 hypothetical protein LTR32_003271 [Rachicladosporium monterosium]